MVHFSSLGQFSVHDDSYIYTEPLFGISNTDQSFYEPSSSRISNSFSSVKNETKFVSEEDAWKIPLKPNGVTREELSQMYENAQNNLEQISKDDAKTAKTEKLIDSITQNIELMNTTQDTSIQED